MMNGSNRRQSLVLGLCLLFLALVGVARYRSPEFRRPIRIDELITLQEYTWVGLDDRGVRKELRTPEEFESRGALSLRRFVLGVWSSLGRWTEPNNHIAHSVMVNAALALPVDTLSAARLPALLCAIGCSATLAIVCVRAGWLLAAPLVTVATAFHPYVVLYSQESRGYALMLLLCVGTLVGLHALWRRPSSRVAAAVVVGAAIALLVSIVSMAADWVLPVYLAFGFCAGSRRWEADSERRRLFLKSIGWQLALVVFVGALFLCDRLPYVVSSATQYGIPIDSPAEAARTLQGFAQYLFPTLAWQAFGVFAVGGLCVACRDAEARPVAVASAAIVLGSLVHFLVGWRFPYERNMGYALIPVAWGFMYGVAAAYRVARGRWPRVGVALGGALLVATAVGSTVSEPITDGAYEQVIKALEAHPIPLADDDLLVFGRLRPGPVRLLLNTPNGASAGPAGRPRQLVVAERKSHPFEFRGPDGTAMAEQLRRDPNAEVIETPLCRIVAVGMAPADGQALSDQLCLAVWRVPFGAVAVSPQPVFDALQAAGLPYRPITRRYQAKMQVFSRVERVIVPLAAGDPAAFEANRRALEQTVDEVGGEVSYFVLEERRR